MHYRYLLIPIFWGCLCAGTSCKPKPSEQSEQQLNGFRALNLAMHTAQLDARVSGDPSTGYPADAKHTSVAEVRRMLNDKGYLKLEDQKLIDFSNIRIGNVSGDDPSDVVLLITREPIDGQVVYFRKGGDGGRFETGSDKPESELKEPPRSPAYLD